MAENAFTRASGFTRRRFIRKTAVTGVEFSVLPYFGFSTQPVKEKVRLG